ncbi:uncharacterized protein LOC142765536 [Rhipicephalus microplus]|uniref:uncharacterized protein LOC142765536 n=1 Tax=Rhipicephalus microplus TaxID=6941 RepID=UPI003F6CC8D8
MLLRSQILFFVAHIISIMTTRGPTRHTNGFVLLAPILLLKCQCFLTLPPPETPDITKFYAENETIWTVNTTMKTSKYCQVDFVNKTTTNDTYFERIYFWMSNLTTEYLHGKFMKVEIERKNAEIYNAMMIQAQNGTFYLSVEQLLYEFANYTSGIFAVSFMPHLQGI